jgi:methionine-rich copper-binding protein CopC
MRYWSFAIISALILTAIVPLCPGLGVEGVVFEAVVAPGDRISHDMVISLREGEAPMDLAVEINDWNQSQDGTNQPEIALDTVHTYSARNFLNADPAKLHIEPGESRTVIVQGEIPQDVGAGGRYALISINSLPERTDQELENRVGISVAVNALVRLMVSGSELIRRGEIIDACLDDDNNAISASHQNVSLVFRNTGNCHFVAQSEATLRDNDGVVLAKSSSPLSSNILPLSERLFQVSLVPEQELRAGAYSINTTVMSENGHLLASRDIEFRL